MADVDLQIPLAERLRPKSLDDYVGQKQIVGADGPLRLASVLDLYLLLYFGVHLVLVKQRWLRFLRTR